MDVLGEVNRNKESVVFIKHDVFDFKLEDKI